MSFMNDADITEWPTGLFWAGLFTGMGLLIMWNPPPAGQARFYIVGSLAVLAGVTIGLVTTIRNNRR